MAEYFGHSENTLREWQLLREHLEGVAQRVKASLDGWIGCEEGVFAGLYHDIGKYPDSFQQRLRGIGSGYDHWSAGAYFAREQRMLAAAFAIYGHHVGLPELSLLRSKKTLEQFGENHPQQLRLTSTDFEEIRARMAEDGLPLSASQEPSPLFNLMRNNEFGALEIMLYVRRIFSALTDADFLDTEAHMKADPREPGQKLDAGIFLSRLNMFLEDLSSTANSSTIVQQARQSVLSACRLAAQKQPGVFTLTAPTGAGKTLAMLAFALEHAKKHRLRRVITVLPFLTLIEQTTNVYRKVLQPQAEELIEHHSLSKAMEDSGDIDLARRLRALTENWDAPFVLTTSVQFFESLFASKPSVARKLHNIAGSVILLDEVQTIPVELAKYTIGALSCLAKSWNCTIVLATATQPAFEHLSKEIEKFHLPTWSPTPIISNPSLLFSQLRRTKYRFIPKEKTLSNDELADLLREEEQALIVVNLKNQAQDLYRTLKNEREAVFHLSTRNCPEHRTHILAKVRQLLEARKSVVLVATQCIEAGVDIDFSCVYRAYAPLDSIIQAAGRCNREGKSHNGIVTVFEPVNNGLPRGAYTQATCKTKSKLKEWILKYPGFDNPADPKLIQEYFKSLYDIGKTHNKNIDTALKDHDFPEVSEHYRLIAGDTINILVPYQGRIELFEQLRREAEAIGITRTWIKRARPITVSEFRPKADNHILSYLEPLNFKNVDKKSVGITDWYIFLNPEGYDPALGLVPPLEMPEFII